MIIYSRKSTNFLNEHNRNGLAIYNFTTMMNRVQRIFTFQLILIGLNVYGYIFQHNLQYTNQSTEFKVMFTAVSSRRKSGRDWQKKEKDGDDERGVEFAREKERAEKRGQERDRAGERAREI